MIDKPLVGTREKTKLNEPNIRVVEIVNISKITEVDTMLIVSTSAGNYHQNAPGFGWLD